MQDLKIKALQLENAAKEAQITDLEEMSADLTEENMEQGEQITTLEEMVADLYEGSAE